MKLLNSDSNESELIRELVRNHGDIGEFVGVESNDLAFLNDVWTLHTTLGKFIVKRHVKAVVPERISWTQRFLCKLHDYNYPCDRILPSSDGSPVVEINDQVMSVHTYLEGRCIQGGIGRLSKRQQRSAITALAQYHATVLSTQTGEDEPPLLVLDVKRNSTPYSSKNEIAPSPIPLLYSDNVEYLQSYIFADSDFIPRDVRIFLEKILTKLDRFFASLTYRSLPRIIIHGDFRPKNIKIAHISRQCI